MGTKDQDLSNEQFVRISTTMLYLLRNDEEKIWFYIDEVKKYMFKERCPHEDIIEVVECSFNSMDMSALLIA